MGNSLRKKKRSNQSIEDRRPIQKGSGINYSSTSKPFSVSLDEYIKNYENTSTDQEVEETESVILTAGQFENIYMQYKAMNPKTSTLGILMDIDVLNILGHVFDSWQADMIFNSDNYQAYMKTDVNSIRKYTKTEMNREQNNAAQMFLRHSIKMIIFYKMILDRLKMNRAEELLQQLVISHGSLGITVEDFKVMNLHLTKYLLQRNLINDDSIISLVGFLSLVFDEMKNKERERYKARTAYVEYPNICIANYRCMKKWPQIVSLINMKTDIIQKQIRIHNSEEKYVDGEDTIKPKKKF